jgi:hypothetical protein
MTPVWTIRRPFPDELPRVLRMLPPTREHHAINVAVVGRVERIAAAAVLYFGTQSRELGLLRFASSLPDHSSAIILRVLAPLVEEARTAGAAEVVLVGSVAEDHPLTSLLLQAGFERYRQTEVYRVSAAAVLDRVEPVFQRMKTRGMIPPTARAIVPRGAWVDKLRAFLDQQQQTIADRLDREEGFSLRHSLILIVEDHVKGAFFTRNSGSESYIGLMLLDRTLRGGLPWANAFMMREMLQFGRTIGVEQLVGEVHQEEHRGTRLLGQTSGAELICRRWQFRREFLA